jgi:hypothetical protein
LITTDSEHRPDQTVDQQPENNPPTNNQNRGRVIERKHEPTDEPEKKKPHNGEHQTDDDAMIRNIKTETDVVRNLAHGNGDIDTLTTDENAETLTDDHEQTEEKTNQPHAHAKRTNLAQHQNDHHTTQDHRTPQRLHPAQTRVEPEPFAEHRDEHDQTLNHENHQARTQQKQNPIDPEITQTHADNTAEQKPTDARAVKTVTEHIGEETQHENRHHEPPQINTHRAQHLHTTTSTDDVENEEKNNETGNEHG